MSAVREFQTVVGQDREAQRTAAVFVMPPQHPEVQRRRALCYVCTEIVLNPAVKAMLGDRGVQCEKCGCFILLKTRFVNFHCPERKW